MKKTCKHTYYMPKTEEKITPMEKQYNEIKKEVPDSILFFRLGDFYEMFGDDAKEASEILEIALTSRNKKSENPLPMCGIPAKSYDRYVAKLTRAGKKVAIADQISDPSEKGIVQRKITRIITPGTTFSQQILSAKKQNFLVAFSTSNESFALAFAELTTGETFVQNFASAESAFREAEKQAVAEILMTPENFTTYSSSLSYFSGTLSRHFSPEDSEAFLLKFFGIKTLKPFGIENNNSAIFASALLFSFIEETQKSNTSHISGISFRNTSQSLSIDTESIKNLELFSSSDGNKKNGLFFHIDRTKTAMGGRALQQTFLAPFSKKSDIEKRLSKIQELQNDENFEQELKNQLASISDIERILSRIATNRAIPRDFVFLKNSLNALKKIAHTTLVEDSNKWKKWQKKIQNSIEN